MGDDSLFLFILFRQKPQNKSFVTDFTVGDLASHCLTTQKHIKKIISPTVRHSLHACLGYYENYLEVVETSAILWKDFDSILYKSKEQGISYNVFPT